jgi:hypothetical protein
MFIAEPSLLVAMGAALRQFSLGQAPRSQAASAVGVLRDKL